ncbi:MAG: DUF6061 family protein [Faecousia sp.]
MDDGTMLSVGHIAAKIEALRNMHECSELDHLTYDSPVENAGLILNGYPEKHHKTATVYSLFGN